MEENIMKKLIIVSREMSLTDQEKKELDALPSLDQWNNYYSNEEWQRSHTRITIDEFPEAVFNYMKTQEELLQFLYESGINGVDEIRELPNSLINLKPMNQEFIKRCLGLKTTKTELSTEEALKLLGCYGLEQDKKEFFNKMTEEEKKRYCKALEDSKKK